MESKRTSEKEQTISHQSIGSREIQYEHWREQNKKKILKGTKYQREHRTLRT